MRTCLLFAFLGLGLLGLAPTSSDDKTWRPKGDYWDTYHTVIVKAVCDSTGKVQDAEVLFSAASAAEADSVLTVVKKDHFHRSTKDGRLRRAQPERSPAVPDFQFIVPYAIRNNGDQVPLVTRKELEQAGLAPWLQIWDRLLPDWPVESWSHHSTGDYYEYTSIIDDSQMVSLGMVSISPDGHWHLHPFYGVGFSRDGSFGGFEPDGGFVVYPLGDSVRVRQRVTGTPVGYTSAEWIDDHRFVITAYEEVDLSYEGGFTFHHAPVIVLGDVRKLTYDWISGPPIPIESINAAWKELRQYERVRYPKYSLLREKG